MTDFEEKIKLRQKNYEQKKNLIAPSNHKLLYEIKKSVKYFFGFMRGPQKIIDLKIIKNIWGSKDLQI